MVRWPICFATSIVMTQELRELVVSAQGVIYTPSLLGVVHPY